MNTMDICVSQHILYMYYFNCDIRVPMHILTIHSLLHKTMIYGRSPKYISMQTEIV